WSFEDGLSLIAFDPNSSSIIYVATPSGIEVSHDYGESFTAPWSRWASGPAALVTVDPYDNQTIYVGDSSGLYVTNDQGSSWQSCGTLEGEPSAMAIDPLDPSSMLVVTWGGLVERSTNSCGTFVDVTPPMGPAAPGPYPAGVAAFEPGTDIVALGTLQGMYLTTMLGSNWVHVTGNLIPLGVTGIDW
ncbi:lipoprotein, partial [mine drainage metagenome]